MAIINHLENVVGWLSDNEARWLNLYASQITEGCIVEIGSYQGKSTIALALNASVPVYAIDPHYNHTDEIGGAFGRQDAAHFYINIMKAKVSEKVYPIHLPSYELAGCWTKPISLIFIDGAHSYEAVKQDIEGFLPHMVSGGIIAIHDSTWPDIERYLHELDNNPKVQRWQRQDSICAYQVV